MNTKWAASTLLLLTLPMMASANPADIAITGLPQTTQDSLIKALSFSALKTFSTLSKTRQQALAQKGSLELQAILKTQGYFHNTVTQQWNIQGNASSIHYRITLGKPLIITAVIFNFKGQAQNKHYFDKVLKQSPLKKGTRFQQTEYNDLKEALLNRALALGFLDASLTQHKISVNLDKNTAVIHLGLTSGQRYVFGKVHYQQKSFKFANRFLNRYLNFKAGQPYHSHKIATLQNRLSQSRYFSNVNVLPKPNSKTHRIPVDITLTPQKPQQYTLGIGYGTETAARATLTANFPYLNSTGSHFQLQAQVSRIYQQYQANYVIPGSNPMDDFTSWNIGRSHINLLPYSANNTAIGVDSTHRLSRHWNGTLSLHEHFVRFLNNQKISGNTHYLMPQLSLNYQKTRRLPYWVNGFKASAQFTGSHSKILSKFTFAKALLNAHYAVNLGRNSRAFVTLSAGAIDSPHWNRVPPNLRFYAGGISNVRGYSYQSLGPKDAAGKLMGGRYLLTGSLNLEQHLVHKLSGIIFYDRGNAFDDWKTKNLLSGAGLGLSWDTPLGAFRLYFSHPINQPNTHWHFDFTIGAII